MACEKDFHSPAGVELARTIRFSIAQSCVCFPGDVLPSDNALVDFLSVSFNQRQDSDAHMIAPDLLDDNLDVFADANGFRLSVSV